MSTFRGVSSLQQPDGVHSVAKGSVDSDQFRQSEMCKFDNANTLTRHYAVAESRNKISGLLKVNQQLSEENELMKQCIIRLMENADLRSTNALSLAMSQTDERLRKFISESIAGNTSKDKETTTQYRIQPPTPDTSRMKSTNASKSYGTSFKEVRLSELNNDLAAMTPNDPKLLNSHNYTLTTSNRYDSPNPTSIQSYGKTFEEIKLSELADESYFTKSRDSAVDNQHAKVLQSENNDNSSEFQSYGKSFKKINVSELNNDQSSPNSLKYNIASDANSYGKSFRQISLRELEGNSDILRTSVRPSSAKKVRAKSPKLKESLVQHSNQNTTSHVVSQPPMKFGVGKSPYQKSPKSPVTQMHETNSLSYETTNQSRVKKRRNRSRSQRLQTTGPYNLSIMPRRPMSTQLRKGDVQFTKPKRPLSTNDDIQSSISKQNEPRLLLPALLKQILDTTKEKIQNNIPNACVDCTNVPCKCHPDNRIDNVSKQMMNALSESFSNDSLDKATGQQSNVPSSYVNDTANEVRTATQGNKTGSETPHASKQISTLPVIDSPIFTSTQVSKDDDKKYFPTSSGKFKTGRESQREDQTKDVRTKPHPGTSAVVHEVFRSRVDAPNATLMHQDQSNLGKVQYSSIRSKVGEINENVPERNSERLTDDIDQTKVLVQYGDGLPNQSKKRSGINEELDRQPMKVSMNRKTDSSKFEEQSRSKNNRTEAVSNVDQSTPIQNKDRFVKFTKDYQLVDNGIGNPLAFSTPKSPPHAHKEIRSVIQTEETTINPDTTSVAARDITNEKQIKQDSVPKAGDSTNVVDNANDESSKDSIPRKELLLASVDSGNGEQMKTIDLLAKMMRFSGRAKAKYIVHRAVDTLLGYKPNLLIVASAIQAAGKPNKRLVGEISFQLDRRILEYVFDGVKDKMGKRRSRYYGYSVASILQLIDKEVKYANNDADLNRDLRSRLEDILKRLNSLGYKIEHHSEFAQDMVNQFGLLNGEPEPGSVEYLGMKEPAILRVVLGQTLHDDKDLDSMVVILDSLLYMAYNDHRPIFVW